MNDESVTILELKNNNWYGKLKIFDEDPLQFLFLKSGDQDLYRAVEIKKLVITHSSPIYLIPVYLQYAIGHRPPVREEHFSNIFYFL